EHRADAGRLTVDIEPRGIEYWLQSEAIRPAPAPEVLLRLPGQAPMHALSQVVEEDFVHQPFEAPMNLPRLARGVVAVARGYDPQSDELQTPDGTLALHRIAGQARQVINDEDIEFPLCSRLQHGSVLRPVRVRAAHCSVGIGGDDGPPLQLRALAAIAELVLDARGTLQVGAEACVESGLHLLASVCFR